MYCSDEEKISPESLTQNSCIIVTGNTRHGRSHEKHRAPFTKHCPVQGRDRSARSSSDTLVQVNPCDMATRWKGGIAYSGSVVPVTIVPCRASQKPWSARSNYSCPG